MTKPYSNIMISYIKFGEEQNCQVQLENSQSNITLDI